jgi:hypothetical protein
MGNDKQKAGREEAERVMAQDWGWGIDEKGNFGIIDYDKYKAFQETARSAGYKCPHCGKRPAGWIGVTGKCYQGAFYKGTNTVCIDCSKIASDRSIARRAANRAQKPTPRRRRRTKAELEADMLAAKLKEEQELRQRLSEMVVAPTESESESESKLTSPAASPSPLASPTPLANQDAIMARFELMEQKILDLQKVAAHLVAQNNKLRALHNEVVGSLKNFADREEVNYLLEKVAELESKQPTHRPPPLSPLIERVDVLSEKLDIACGEIDSVKEEVEALQVEAPRFVESPWPIKVEPEEPNAMKYLFTDDVDPHREEEPVPPEDEENLSNDAQTRRIQKEMNEDKWEFRLPKRCEMGKGEYDFSHLSLPKC